MMMKYKPQEAYRIIKSDRLYGGHPKCRHNRCGGRAIFMLLSSDPGGRTRDISMIVIVDIAAKERPNKALREGDEIHMKLAKEVIWDIS